MSFDGRLLCAACIARANESPLLPKKKSSHLGQLLLGVAALVFVWVFFYCVGWIILQYRETLPDQESSSEPRPLVSGPRPFSAASLTSSAPGILLSHLGNQ